MRKLLELCISLTPSWDTRPHHLKDSELCGAPQLSARVAKLSYGKALLVSSLATSHGGQVAGVSQLGKMLEPGGRILCFSEGETP